MPSTDRARHIATAANRIHGHAAHIVSAAMTCHEDQLIAVDVSPEGEVLIAVIPAWGLREHVLTSPNGYRTVIFTNGVTMDDVEDRCLRMGAQAYKRWKLSAAWNRKHPGSEAA